MKEVTTQLMVKKNTWKVATRQSVREDKARKEKTNHLSTLDMRDKIRDNILFNSIYLFMTIQKKI